MNIQEDVDAGRFHNQWLPYRIRFEDMYLDSLTIQILTNMGHDLRKRPSIGMVSATMVQPDGKKAGGADKRGDNSSCGF